MRSTVRIDDDLMEELRQRAANNGVSLTRTLNEVLRAGMRERQGVAGKRRRYREKTFRLGEPRVDLTKALAVAAALEDEEILRKVALRK